jgi:hypothetical protein
MAHPTFGESSDLFCGGGGRNTGGGDNGALGAITANQIHELINIQNREKPHR